MIGVFCIVVAVILVVVYFRHFLSYPRDFKLLQVASCADLNHELTSKKHPIVVEGVTDSRKCAVSPWHPVVVRGRGANLYHPDDNEEYLKVELSGDSALLVPWRWRYEALPESTAQKAWQIWWGHLMA